MKRHLLLTTALLLAPCRTDKEILHTADTVYIARHHYDSLMIDRYTTTENKGDTVLVDRLTTEYRYRLRTDTLHLYHTDTIVKTTYKEAPTKSRETLQWVTFGLMVLVLWIMRKRIF